MELPSQLSEDPVLIPWGNLFLQVIAKEIPLSELPAEKEERTAYPWTKAKKWAFANLNRLFSRYAVQTSMGDSKATAFGKHFIANFAPEIMKSYLQQIELYMAHKIWLSERCVYLIVDFLEEWFVAIFTLLIGSIKPKVTWGLLKPHVPSIISHVVFPLLCLTQEDLDLWDEDPVEYIHKKIGSTLLVFRLT
jgi:importin-7